MSAEDREEQQVPSLGGAAEPVPGGARAAASERAPRADDTAAGSASEPPTQQPSETSSTPAPAAEQASDASPPAAEGTAARIPAEPQSAPRALDAGRPGVPAVAAVQDALTADGLLALMRRVFPTGRTLHWSACLDTLGVIAAGLPEDLTGWSEGRAWGARAELRWQPAGVDRFSALYLGEGDAPPEGFQALAGDLRAVPSGETEGLILWGVRGSDGRYREPRLPRPQDYAALDTTAPETRVPCRLLVDATGQVRFISLAVEEGAE